MKRNSSKGFTLVEVLIAMLILGIGLSLIYTIFPLGIRISREVQFLGRISFFAQKKIEELKTFNATIADSSGQEASFNWTIKVSDHTAGANAVLKKIQLEALWEEGKTIRSKRFITLFKHQDEQAE
ncbi:prepilin-type N-terminal cleavage/methylation domain-containing protein [Candidatus Omnitrophota bacterium]